MSGFHCLQPRVRNAIPKSPRRAPENPYSPTSRDYAERNRVTESVTLSGRKRVDIGQPLP